MPTTTVNPIKSAREELGWTQTRLANKANISRMALLRAEQGLYDTPPVAILTALSPNFNSVPLDKSYRDWCEEHRRVVGAKALPQDFRAALAVAALRSTTPPTANTPTTPCSGV